MIARNMLFELKYNDDGWGYMERSMSDDKAQVEFHQIVIQSPIGRIAIQDAKKDVTQWIDNNDILYSRVSKTISITGDVQLAVIVFSLQRMILGMIKADLFSTGLSTLWDLRTFKSMLITKSDDASSESQWN